MGTKADLPNKIVTWLHKQGYPLEMEVARTFLSSGFNTQQSVYYMDPESGDSRETDVLAHRDVVGASGLFRLSLVIECKNTPQPWLLFSTGHDQLPDAPRVAQRIASVAGQEALLALLKCPDIPTSPLFNMTDSVGYGLTQAFATGSDVAYGALKSVSKAALSFASSFDSYSSSKKAAGPTRSYFHVVFPVVVIGCSLFRCTLNANGEQLDVAEIPYGTLVWKNPVSRQPHTMFHVVTREYLKAFADDAAATCRAVKAAIEGPAKSALAKIAQLHAPRPAPKQALRP